MERSQELQVLSAADDAAIRNNNAGRSQKLGMGLLVVAGAVAVYFLVLAPERKTPKDMLDASGEQFNPTTFTPPDYVRDPPKQEKKKDNIVKLPVEQPQTPKPADTTEFNVPPPPSVVTAPETVAPPPAIAQTKQDEFPDRFKSKQVVVDEGGKTVNQPGLSGEAGANAPTVAGTDANSKFLSNASAMADRSSKAVQLRRLDALVPEGTLIPGILETAVNSDLPGQVRAIVSKDVWSFDGRRIIIPTGTRLIGEYQSSVMTGQTRIFVVWTRLIRSDGASIRLNSIGADSLGRSGITGNVDKHFTERFGNAILLSIVGGGASYLTGFGGGSNSTGTQTDAQRAADIARTTIAQTFSNMANQALSDGLKIPPTISVPQGERIFVYVRQDLDFSALYPDPVAEALKEIKHERGYQ